MLFTARIEPPWLTRHMTTFRHVLMMRFRDDASEEQIEAFFDGLASMPKRIDQIRCYDFGPDLGLGSSNFDMALIADFDSEDDWHSYDAHPHHQAFVAKDVVPIVAEAVRVQYEVS